MQKSNILHCFIFLDFLFSFYLFIHCLTRACTFENSFFIQSSYLNVALILANNQCQCCFFRKPWSDYVINHVNGSRMIKYALL